MNKEQIQAQITTKQARLNLYLAQETKILTNGVQAYGIGPRNLQKYQTALSDIRDTIKTLESEITTLTGQLNGKTPRKSVGIIPRDW